MAIIKSSTEHLTLNADGAGKDIKFQANGVEKASIDSSGNFTSTSIDATKLSGTVPNFTSTGIDDNATSTAITIDASENVGIGNTTPSMPLEVTANSSANSICVAGRSSDDIGGLHFLKNSGTLYEVGTFELQCRPNNSPPYLKIQGRDSGGDNFDSIVFTNDGRGLSQFTAKAWCNWNGEGTVAIRDSHNISSIIDIGTGDYSIYYANNMANDNYSIAGMAEEDGKLMLKASNYGSFHSVSRCRVAIKTGGTFIDREFASFQIFGD